MYLVNFRQLKGSFDYHSPIAFLINVMEYITLRFVIHILTLSAKQSWMSWTEAS